MKKFREFLNEKKRSPQEAQKVVDYLAKRTVRYGGDKDEIPFKQHRYPGDNDPNLQPHMFTFMGIKRIPIKDLKPGQPTFSHTGITHHIWSDRNERKPIVAVKYSDGIRVHDGHHRLKADQSTGYTHADVHLYKPNKSWKPEED